MSVKMNQKRNKRRLTAGLDKVGFIEAQGLPWYLVLAARPVGASESDRAEENKTGLRRFRFERYIHGAPD